MDEDDYELAFQLFDRTKPRLVAPGVAMPSSFHTASSVAPSHSFSSTTASSAQMARSTVTTTPHKAHTGPTFRSSFASPSAPKAPSISPLALNQSANSSSGHASRQFIVPAKATHARGPKSNVIQLSSAPTAPVSPPKSKTSVYPSFTGDGIAWDDEDDVLAPVPGLSRVLSPPKRSSAPPPRSPAKSSKTHSHPSPARGNRESTTSNAHSLSLGAPDEVSTSTISTARAHECDDAEAKTWQYPSNYEKREYQFAMVESALFRNTLVCLPTGLGKTLIAAVVMYNFYRWFPNGKIIFMAPSKPLVAQQIEACKSIVSLPAFDCIAMTGVMSVDTRAKHWTSKRVFFVTPQIPQNDIASGICPAEQVCLLVFDEAHKAHGDFAYCDVIRGIAKHTPFFRVLALSATPGGDLQSIQDVLTNLLISNIELRTEESPDVKPYLHTRFVHEVSVKLDGPISKAKELLKTLIGVPITWLQSQGALYRTKKGDFFTFTRLEAARDDFRNNPNMQRKDEFFRMQAEARFATAMSLYHGLRLISDYGLGPFKEWLNVQTAKPVMEKTSNFFAEMVRSKEWTALYCYVNEEIGDASRCRHPKLTKLEGIVLDHFQEVISGSSTASVSSAAVRAPMEPDDEGRGDVEKEPETRVMIFVQYRDTVEEIVRMLKVHEPFVRPMAFIGQSKKGLSQKQQAEVVQKFREGHYNTLVSTSIGEEGLDIGEVDLIVCYDTQQSPIRMIQRMGRTGRKRNGKCIMLLTAGTEDVTYKRSKVKSKAMIKAISCSSKFHFFNGAEANHLLPAHLPTPTPVMWRMERPIEPEIPTTSRARDSNTNANSNDNENAPTAKRTRAKRGTAAAKKTGKGKKAGNAETASTATDDTSDRFEISSRQAEETGMNVESRLHSEWEEFEVEEESDDEGDERDEDDGQSHFDNAEHFGADTEMHANNFEGEDDEDPEIRKFLREYGSKTSTSAAPSARVPSSHMPVPSVITNPKLSEPVPTKVSPILENPLPVALPAPNASLLAHSPIPTRSDNLQKTIIGDVPATTVLKAAGNASDFRAPPLHHVAPEPIPAPILPKQSKPTSILDQSQASMESLDIVLPSDDFPMGFFDFALPPSSSSLQNRRTTQGSTQLRNQDEMDEDEDFQLNGSLFIPPPPPFSKPSHGPLVTDLPIDFELGLIPMPPIDGDTAVISKASAATSTTTTATSMAPPITYAAHELDRPPQTLQLPGSSSPQKAPANTLVHHSRVDSSSLHQPPFGTDSLQVSSQSSRKITESQEKQVTLPQHPTPIAHSTPIALSPQEKIRATTRGTADIDTTGEKAEIERCVNVSVSLHSLDSHHSAPNSPQFKRLKKRSRIASTDSNNSSMLDLDESAGAASSQTSSSQDLTLLDESMSPPPAKRSCARIHSEKTKATTKQQRPKQRKSRFIDEEASLDSENSDGGDSGDFGTCDGGEDGSVPNSQDVAFIAPEEGEEIEGETAGLGMRAVYAKSLTSAHVVLPGAKKQKKQGNTRIGGRDGFDDGLASDPVLQQKMKRWQQEYNDVDSSMIVDDDFVEYEDVPKLGDELSSSEDELVFKTSSKNKTSKRGRSNRRDEIMDDNEEAEDAKQIVAPPRASNVDSIVLISSGESLPSSSPITKTKTPIDELLQPESCDLGFQPASINLPSPVSTSAPVQPQRTPSILSLSIAPKQPIATKPAATPLKLGLTHHANASSFSSKFITHSNSRIGASNPTPTASAPSTASTTQPAAKIQSAPANKMPLVTSTPKPFGSTSTIIPKTIASFEADLLDGLTDDDLMCIDVDNLRRH